MISYLLLAMQRLHQRWRLAIECFQQDLCGKPILPPFLSTVCPRGRASAFVTQLTLGQTNNGDRSQLFAAYTLADAAFNRLSAKSNPCSGQRKHVGNGCWVCVLRPKLAALAYYAYISIELTSVKEVIVNPLAASG